MPQPTPDKPFDIKGVKGKAYPRLNVLEFSTNPIYSKQWYLFLQAMTNITKHAVDGPDSTVLNHDRPLGYYQIAGIHGAPFIHWVKNQHAGDRPGNYCTHGTALFLTWHRPYLILLEQCIVDEALKVANKLPTEIRAEYTNEAGKIRFPYWDWAFDSNVPEPLRNPIISISHPSPPTTEKIHNPLYSYRFESTEIRVRDFQITGTKEYVEFDATKRCPDAWGYSHPEIVDRQLRGPISPNPNLPTNWSPGIYQLLTTVKTYGAFGNNGWKKDHPDDPYPQDYQSLESFHNAIHNYTGTNYSVQPIQGHMSDTSVSAFDPIFYHVNIDRLYAMWQCMHYNAEFQGQTAAIDRLPAPPPRTADLVTTALRPFRYIDESGAIQVWDSTKVQRTSQNPAKWPSVYDFNYSYPEIRSNPTNETERAILSGQVYLAVRALYHRQGRNQNWDDPPADFEPVGRLIDSATNFRLEWMVCLHVRKYIVKGNFIIFFFLGQPEAEPRNWVASPNLTGSFHTFKSDSDYCVNCASQEEADARICGGVHLTNPLFLKRENLTAGREEVAEWLQRNLRWRILMDDGTEFKLQDLRPEDLTVKVISFGMRYPKATIPTDGHGPEILDSVCNVHSPKKHFEGTIPSDMRAPLT